jgi:hypothetical protein
VIGPHRERWSGSVRVDAGAPGGSIGGGVLTSLIVSVFVLATGIFMAGRRPPWALQPAMAGVANVGASTRRGHDTIAAAVRFEEDDDRSIVMDSLRALGVVRREVERPVVGRKAYVRLWERVRALIVLATVIATVGVLLAATIGITFLAVGFLLEQAIG